MSSSKLLKEKNEADILAPVPAPFAWNGESYAIYPMPDSTLIRVGDSLADVSRLLDGIAAINTDGRAFSNLSTDEMVQMLAPFLPQIVRFLLPNASRIIAGCLRLDEARVADEMPLTKKLEALRLIVIAEDLPLIVKNFIALAGTFAPPTPQGETTD